MRGRMFSLFLCVASLWMGPCLGWNSSSAVRRELLQRVVAAPAAITILMEGQPPSGWAAEEHPPPPTTIQKPFAPVDRLVPAARVKWTIDRALRIADSPSSDCDDPYWTRLQRLLLIPQNYTEKVLPDLPAAPGKIYLDTYRRNRERLNVLAQPGALLVQSGEIAAWKRLKRQERQRERDDEVRAALNLYTSSLNYDAQSYLLNVSPAERKQMIRNERLPDVTQVIQSDMGLRYLMRNELLTAMGEVRAELEYQLNKEDRSNRELVELLQKAQIAADQWIALIDPRDVQEAMRLVQDEKERGGNVY